MSNEWNEKEGLREYERKVQGGHQPDHSGVDKGRVPDQQNRLKDQENLRR